MKPKPVEAKASSGESGVMELAEEKQDFGAPIVDVGSTTGEVASENESLEALVEAAAQVERSKAGAGGGGGVTVPPRMSSIAMVIPAKLLFGLGRS